MPISEIASALSALQAAKDIAQSAMNLRDSAAFQGQLIELQSKILDAQSSASAAYEERLALIDQVRELKEELAGFKAWDAKEEKYELKPIPSYHKPLAYALKEEAKCPEPSHWLCATCFQNRMASILQPEVRSPGRCSVLVCHECGADHYLSGDRVSAHPTSRKSR